MKTVANKIDFNFSDEEFKNMYDSPFFVDNIAKDIAKDLDNKIIDSVKINKKKLETALYDDKSRCEDAYKRGYNDCLKQPLYRYILKKILWRLNYGKY